MRKLVEKQLSWLALIMTAFYSLLASCRGEECGHEELVRCAAPLQKMRSNDLGFVTKKEQFQELCPDLEAGMDCIKKYTVRCMKPRQRSHFYSLYTETNQVIMELCQDGPYQDKFLKHAPCMQKVQAEYEQCFKKYQKIAQEIEMGNQTGSVESICCAFQEYLNCSHHMVQKQCGEETAKFTKDFLDRMSNPLMKHCERYRHGECVVSGVSSIFRIDLLIPVVLILLGRYFT